MYFLFNLFWVICIGKRRFVDPSLKMEDHIHVRVTEFKVIPMIQEIRKEIGMIAPNWNLLQVDYEFSLSLSLRRWGHHFLGHALVVRMAQHIHVGYCSQKKFLNPEKKKRVFFWCSNSVVASKPFAITGSTWIPDLSGETTIRVDPMTEADIPRPHNHWVLRKSLAEGANFWLPLNGKRWQDFKLDFSQTLGKNLQNWAQFCDLGFIEKSGFQHEFVYVNKKYLRFWTSNS